MKRFFIGIVLLVLLFLGGHLTARVLHADFEPIALELRQASREALEGDRILADRLSRLARERWEAGWKRTAVFADHGPMEQIDGLFAQLEVYRDTGNTAAFSAICLRLALEISELGEDHRLSWWNFL